MGDFSSDEIPTVGDSPGEDSGAQLSEGSVSGAQPRSATEEVEELPRMLGTRYRLERLIAKGGMGRVYEGVQLPLERKVAIKVLVAPPNVSGDFRRRFLLEASVCAKLTHPNIVVLHDYGEGDAGELFMAMELLDGDPLNRVLHREGALHPLRAIEITLAVARALRIAHREGVAHRDLKPGNVFLVKHTTDDNRQVDHVKVLDFGLVKVYEDGRSHVEGDLTEGGTMLGSPRYMSPEQILCEPVDHRADIYSLGILLYAMLVGQPPFNGKSPIDILTQHLQRDPPSFDSVLAQRKTPLAWTLDPGLEAIVRRCLEKQPQDRYQDVDEVIVALKKARGVAMPGDSLEWTRSTTTSSFDDVAMSQEFAAMAPEPTPTPTPSPGATLAAAPEPSDRRRWIPIVALFAIVVVIGAIAGLMVPGPDEAPTAPAPVAEPPETAIAAPVTAVEVTVTSEPAGAEVTSGGVLLGETPLTVSLPPTPAGGRRLFELTLDGHRPGRAAEAIAGERVAVHVDLEAIPEEPTPTPPPPVATSSSRRSTRSAARAEETRPTATSRPGTTDRGAAAEPAGETSTRRGSRLPEEGRSIVVDHGESRVPIVD